MNTQAKIEGAASAAVTQVAGIALLTKDAIKKGQDGIRKSLLKLDAEIHTNAVQCMMHASAFGDTSLFRRLLIDIVDAKSGYRRQGIINWMRKHSPMELKGDIINLSGTIENAGQLIALKKAFPDANHDGWTVGMKRPFMVAEANASPFTTDAGNAERVAKPIFKDTLMNPLLKAHKDFMQAVENTANGQPIDASKPFYDGIHMDKVTDFWTKVAEMQAALPQDDTREVRLTQKRIAEDTQFVEANKGNVNQAAVAEKLAAVG